MRISHSIIFFYFVLVLRGMALATYMYFGVYQFLCYVIISIYHNTNSFNDKKIKVFFLYFVTGLVCHRCKKDHELCFDIRYILGCYTNQKKKQSTKMCGDQKNKCSNVSNDVEQRRIRLYKENGAAVVRYCCEYIVTSSLRILSMENGIFPLKISFVMKIEKLCIKFIFHRLVRM